MIVQGLATSRRLVVSRGSMCVVTMKMPTQVEPQRKNKRAVEPNGIAEEQVPIECFSLWISGICNW